MLDGKIALTRDNAQPVGAQKRASPGETYGYKNYLLVRSTAVRTRLKFIGNAGKARQKLIRLISTIHIARDRDDELSHQPFPQAIHPPKISQLVLFRLQPFHSGYTELLFFISLLLYPNLTCPFVLQNFLHLIR